MIPIAVYQLLVGMLLQVIAIPLAKAKPVNTESQSPVSKLISAEKIPDPGCDLIPSHTQSRHGK